MSAPTAAAAAAGSTAPHAAPERELTHREILEVLFGLLAAIFTALISSTIVSTALPTIVGDLNGSQTTYTWVVTTSLLAMTVSTPIWAKLSDLVSKKLLVQTSIVVFVAGSVIAGFAQDMPTMLAGRALQGLGMGGLTALAQSIMGSIIPPRQRGRYSGYLAGTMAVSTFAGPLVGGVIVDTLGWRWCFFACIPLAVISLVILQRYLHLPLLRRKVSIDYFGALFIAIAASLPLLWVSFAGNAFAWISPQSGLLVGGAVLALIAAIAVERTHPEPMIPLDIIRERTTMLAIIASIAVGIAQFGSSVFLSQYFQTAQGYSPTQAGLFMMPMIVGTLIGSTGSGLLITRTGRYKRYLLTGTVFLTAGLALMGPINHSTPVWHLSVFMVLMGLGTGMLMQNLVLAVQNTVDVTDVGTASGAVAFFRSLGGAVGVSVLGAVLAGRVDHNVSNGLNEAGIDLAKASGGGSLLSLDRLPSAVVDIVHTAYADATGRIFLIAACVAAVSFVAVLLMKEAPLRTTVRKADEVVDEDDDVTPEILREPAGV
jgi:EmrB/QacA subfamily drug resistance transporter